MQKLRTGAAYHGCRMLHHVEHDMRDMADHNMNLVVHMLSHTDWDRHNRVMKDIVGISEEAGLEVWIDNWGLGGPPGDKSHFLSYYPEAHQIYSTGEPDPVRVCLRQPSFRTFMKAWIDTVADSGAKTIFWDEPHLPAKGAVYSCTCPLCQKAFEERYGRPMPVLLDDDAAEFRLDTIEEYFRDLCDYAASKGLKNAVCVMLGEGIGINLSTLGKIGGIESLDNIGSDPYWGYREDVNPYEFVYRGTRKTLETAEQFGKDHNVWIQAFGVPRGREEEIVQATEAAYDAGARTIIAWGYFGSISNDYAAQDPYLTRVKMNEAFARIRGFERDRVRAENRRLVGLKD